MTINAMLNWAGISLIIFVVSLFAVFVLKEFHVNYNFKNLFRDIIDILDRVFFGKKYIAKIDGTWRLVRGWKEKVNLNVIFPPDYISYNVFYGDWKNIGKHWTDKRTEDEIARLNILDLKRKHPESEDFHDIRRRCYRIVGDEIVGDEPEEYNLRFSLNNLSE